MSQQAPTTTRSESMDIATPLAETMDVAIGEATTVMGAMIQELMRRSLRGGVVKLGEQLESYVSDTVDHTLEERVPELEKAAVSVAEQTAEVAAARVAGEEVAVLEAKTTETAQSLAGQIEDVDRRSDEKSRELDDKIDVVDRKADESSRELSGKIEGTYSDLSHQVQDLVERSRRGGEILKSRIKVLESTFKSTQQQVEDLQQVNEALLARVAELERPRGLRALWARLFGRRLAQQK